MIIATTTLLSRFKYLTNSDMVMPIQEDKANFRVADPRNEATLICPALPLSKAIIATIHTVVKASDDSNFSVSNGIRLSAPTFVINLLTTTNVDAIIYTYSALL